MGVGMGASRQEVIEAATRLGIFDPAGKWFKKFHVGGMRPETWSQQDLDTIGLRVRKNPEEFALFHLGSMSSIYARLNPVGSLRIEEIRWRRGSALSAEQMYDAVMSHFGDRVRSISAYWPSGNNLATVNRLNNLATVNRLVAGGMPVEQAITKTWEANRAVAYGFNRWFDLHAEPGELPGTYKSITVNFIPQEGLRPLFRTY